MAYEKPHVAVNQNFALSPTSAAVEGLPPAICATNYQVYEKENLGDLKGPFKNLLDWGHEDNSKVLFNEEVSGKVVYDFFPVKIYLETQYFGDIDVTDKFNRSSEGIKNTSSKFKIPDTEISNSIGEAYMPHYRNTSVQIEVSSGSKIVKLKNAALNNARLVRGQAIYVNDGSGSYDKIGEVLAVSSDGSKITMLNAASSNYNTTAEILIGATPDNPSIPNTITSSINLRGKRVKQGDIIKFNSKSLPGNDPDNPFTASIKNLIDDYTVEINTSNSGQNSIDALHDINEYEGFQVPAGGRRVNLNYMSCEKLISYATYTNVESDSTNINKVDNNTWTISGNTDIALVAGDLIAITNDVGSIDTTTDLLTISSITNDGTDTTIVTEEEYTSDYSSEAIEGWAVLYTGKIKASYRAIDIDSEEAVYRITGVEDIENYFGEITPYNELAYMCFITQGINGGQVVYARKTDSRLDEIVSSYSSALSDMRKHDVYSTVLGTLNSGVNSLLPGHVNEQSEPYKQHERIGIVTFDPMDVFLMGSGTVNTVNDNNITVDFDPSNAEIGIDDKVFSNGEYLGKVLGTPDSSTIPVEGSVINNINNGDPIDVIAGRNGVKAEKISSLSYGDRRMTIIWPGTFSGEIGGERIDVPGYFISAAIAGMDDIESPSQSFTNFDYGIPGISNISLKTDTVYQVEELDSAVSGGIDMMVQDGSFISQLISSRHDLTTDMTDILRRERSVTKQADVAAKTLRNAIKPYIGKYNITNKFLGFLEKTLVTRAKALSGGTTKTVTIKSVKEDPNVADKILIGAKLTVYVAGNYYEINLNVNV